jgi:A/G-specific adenine glycosylase
LSGAYCRAFRAALLRWFDRNRRSLPWRADRDPYRVWVSEIMLQQTRVAAVLDRYPRFLERFPSVFSLARARTSSVLAAWSGLGYYRRARLMHAAARLIVREGKGRFPHDCTGWRRLPGVGRYTAAAIASICYDEPCAVVDGNVERAIRRALGEDAAGVPPQRAKNGGAGNPGVWARAAELLDRRRPGDFNQAFMELGATVCTPQSPRCPGCPVRRLCRTFPAEVPPAVPKRRARQKVRLAYALAVAKGRVFLVQRGNRETVMPGMWELPQLPWPLPGGGAWEGLPPQQAKIGLAGDPIPPQQAKIGLAGDPIPPQQAKIGLAGDPIPPQQAKIGLAGDPIVLKHAIMDTDYLVHVVWHSSRQHLPLPFAEAGKWFNARRAAGLPLTGLARKALKRAHLI